jgi:hypothetical protein
MKVRIKGLVQKKGRYYWQPNEPERKAGWKPVGFGVDLDAAMKGARARNDEIEAWRTGGAKPREIRKYVARATVDHLIERWKQDLEARKRGEKAPKLAESTFKLYEHNLTKISAWAGPEPVAAITKKRVHKLRDLMMAPVPCGACEPCQKRKPCEQPAIRHTMAFNVLSTLRSLMKFAVNEELIATNPAAEHGLGKPAAREQVWSPEARAALLLEASKPITIDGGTWQEVCPPETSIGLALMLGFAIGQREADLLNMSIAQYDAIPAYKMDAEVYATLAGLAPDGVVRGIRIRQRKTRRWIEVPLVGEVRAAVEANIKRAKEANLTTILFDDRTLRSWGGREGQGRFQRRFAQLRELAIAGAREAGTTWLVEELAELEFRDLRRTAVVYLGELGLPDHLIAAITGHDLDETKTILETYMPRTTGMAARAIAMTHAREAKEKREAAA